jgi:hypothetical protein
MLFNDVSLQNKARTLSFARKLVLYPVSYRLRVFENRVLMRVFGVKVDEIRGGWRKLHDEENHHY